jgi:hypothetical protein
MLVLTQRRRRRRFRPVAARPWARQLQHFVVVEFLLEILAVGEEVEELELGLLLPADLLLEVLVEKLFQEAVFARAAALDL